MESAVNMKVNRLPSITWNWLRMNEAHIEGVKVEKTGDMKAQVPGGINAETLDASRYADAKTGMGPEMSALSVSAGVSSCSYTAGEGKKITEPLRLDFNYQPGCRDINNVDLTAAAGSEMTVIMKFGTDDEDAAVDSLAAVQTRYHVAQGAVLHIIQVQTLGEHFTFLNDIGGECDDNGRIEVIQIVLGNGQTYLGTRADLKGKQSYFRADLGYVVGGNGKLDINYVADHPAKKTESLINASGVLRNTAHKLFRGTIDLHRGCAGSVGNEKEDVLLIDDDVVNQTIPLILCDEEDVVGNHGATIGRLDESLLFYLQSRGLDEQHVYEMMARARIDAVSALIPDEQTRNEISSYQDRHYNTEAE